MKLLVCSISRTIVKTNEVFPDVGYKDSLWHLITNLLGDEAVKENDQNYREWEKGDKGKYNNNYVSWIKDTYELHKKYSLKKDDFLKVIKNVKYANESKSFFDDLDRKEWLPVFISGGFQNLLDKVMIDLNVNIGLAACGYFFDILDNYLAGYSVFPCEFELKTKFIDLILKHYGLNKKKDWIFVGEGKNDIEIAKAAPVAFAINPCQELIENVKDLKQVKSFKDIIPFLNNIDRYIPKDPMIIKDQPSPLPTDENTEIINLRKRIAELDHKNKELKMENNDLKGRITKNRSIEYYVKESDYTLKPERSLSDLSKELKIGFLGMHKESITLDNIRERGITTISCENNNFDTTKIDFIDFLFIYKNVASHSVVWHAIGNRMISVCYLKEHNNIQLLENAMANVICRYLKKDKSSPFTRMMNIFKKPWS